MRISDWSSDVCSSDLLRALEEAHAAVDAVRDLLGQQRFFEHARLRIAAVQDRAVAVAAAVAHPLADALNHEPRLVDLVVRRVQVDRLALARSEEHTSELQSLMRISYAVLCLKKKKKHKTCNTHQ